MKNLFTTLVLALCFTGFASAQSFYAYPPVVEVTASPDSTDVIAHNDLINQTSSSKTVRWTRTVLCLNPDTACTQICDLNLCYLCHVSTKTFNLAANASGLMTVHFVRDPGVTGSAIVRLDFVNTANPADSTSATYIFNSCVSGTNNPLPEATVKIFPNPTTDFFTLTDADAVGTVRLYAADGRQLQTWPAAPGASYSLAEFPVGVYFVALEDTDGRLFQATQIKKQ